MFAVIAAGKTGIIIPSVVGLTGLGALFGFALAIASRKFRVEVDPRVEEITQLLPSANCGACGFAGCAGYAEALVKGIVDLGSCPPSSSEITSRIAQMLGKEAKAKEKWVAFLHCGGGKVSKRRFVYDGISTCAAANLVGGGNLGCEFGCTAFYDCVRACPFGAIEIDEIGMPYVNPEKCTGCGICVKVCPRNLLELVPANKTIFVACSNPERGKFVRLVCEVGCIGCFKCFKVCKPEAIEMREGLAVIHHEKCTLCGDCIPVCPKSIIVDFSKGHTPRVPSEVEAS